MSKTLQGHCTKLNITKTTEAPTVSSRGQTILLYCAVSSSSSSIYLPQSRSPNHCQTTTGKVQSSARDGTSSATVYSWRRQAVPCTVHVPRPLGRYGRRALNVWWTVPPWLCQRRADDVKYVSTSDVRRRLSVSARYNGAVPWRQR